MLDNLILQFRIIDIMRGSISVNSAKATKKVLVNVLYLERVSGELPITIKHMPTQYG